MIREISRFLSHIQTLIVRNHSFYFQSHANSHKYHDHNLYHSNTQQEMYPLEKFIIHQTGDTI